MLIARRCVAKCTSEVVHGVAHPNIALIWSEGPPNYKRTRQHAPIQTCNQTVAAILSTTMDTNACSELFYVAQTGLPTRTSLTQTGASGSPVWANHFSSTYFRKSVSRNAHKTQTQAQTPTPTQTQTKKAGGLGTEIGLKFCVRCRA